MSRKKVSTTVYLEQSQIEDLAALAARYGVTRSYVSSIRSGVARAIVQH